ncbi:MAG: indole-3-glycerol phosphate synthase TrpC [Bryobacteraceae bacterium]|nr:indole-3-glycerol phosphate synthase TrpC [Bryobacteraceae bacterium]
MTAEVPDILARIVSRKREEVAAKEPQRRSLEQSAAYQTPQRRGFRAMLERKRPALIAEIKKASPSKGLLAAEFNPAERARQYFQGGAAAISVLTDRDFFQGSLSDLKMARAVAPVPVLRKDFTIAEIDVIEAAAAGADAILLIAAILDTPELRRLRELAGRYQMAALVEVHDEWELERALDSGAEIIGVNNRDLRTFEVKLETSELLAARMPAGVLRVSESGIHSREDIARLAASGYQAFLVGEHLMKSGDPAAALKALQNG